MLDKRAQLKSKFDIFATNLPTEADLFSNWSNNHKVAVSIVCATFEHGLLLEDAIKSFLLQRTDFRFEIIIRDDASTDDTHDIIVGYMKRYPRIIRTQIYNENQFKMGKRPIDDFVKLSIGKYVAFCDGDDFWIDRDKLQDQVRQLEKNPDCVISVAGNLCYNVNEDDLQEGGLVAEESTYTKPTPQYHHTSSLVIERRAFVIVAAKQKKYSVYGDTALRHLLLDEGKCICLPRLVSVYWIDGLGIWSSLSKEKRVKEHVVIFARLIRALQYRNKLVILPTFFNACADYFSIALRKGEWAFVSACFFPFLWVKARNWSRSVVHRFRMEREA